ncbi:Glutathione-regulated potassium-efflux system protein KefB [Marinobacterium lacunae]|uniref:Glutathione-regulated potassium-efflux system protein KefB n=1 Tax=Marinobacterium lacunae TaxID=1232683 RepID=A0A081FXE9_9GAMM|nr:monovalent cation:proton antiporter family protein [Marinobacterium lacunae]KEA63204.1 Glutathione-regulated potassium-efflux system protein KefB [Marinobacterium lacunae]MBR9883061.1 potassium:proton antiporter [Oceanospirillales bacterium]
MEHPLFEQLLLILVGAVIATTVFRRFNLPPILAYLAIGALLGPYALQVTDPHQMTLMSELGVVFLLFMLGLEFSLPRMIAMRKLVFGLGSLQVILTTLVLILISIAFGIEFRGAIVIAGALALSSTAIVTRELLRLNQLSAPHGQLSFGILLFQDLAAVFFLIVVPVLGSDGGNIDTDTLLLSLLQGAGLLLLLMVLGRTVLPALFHEIARSRSDEMFVLMALVTALAAAWLTHAAGLSMALGGFLAGMMLGESHYKHQLEADIRPFRDVLLGLFFVTVGMQLNLNTLVENWYWVILFTLGLMLLKAAIISLVTGRLNHDPSSALRAGLCLSQGGEFGFALLALGLGHQMVDSELNAMIVSTIILSMIFTPMLINYSGPIASKLLKQSDKTSSDPFTPPTLEELSNATEHVENHVIICGFGRVGQIVARFLRPLNIPYIAIDSDPFRTHEAAQAGEPMYYGDARRGDILKAIGAERARLLILTVPDHVESMAALKQIKRNYPDLPVLVRTQDDSKLELYQNAGAAEVVPEALEGSLMLVSHILTLLEVPSEEIRSRIDEVRSQRYQMLHGFLHGKRSRKVTEAGIPNELRHPVTLTQDCYATGRTLGSLGLKTVVVSLRRGDIELGPPPHEECLEAGDILILSGEPSLVEADEERLFSG